MKITTLSLVTLMAIPVMAQKKSFTIDDLMPGGSTYYEHTVPENKYFTWWGDKCVEQALGACNVWSDNGTSSTLLTLEQVNAALKGFAVQMPEHLYGVTFPYAGKSLALVPWANERSIVDWQQGKTVWHVTLEQGAENEDWNALTRHTAYTLDHNLYVLTAEGKRLQVSTDGSIDVCYGEAVHRNEFGIEKGTFWSPDGKQLAFYRMDQSMVTKYPQVNLAWMEDGKPVASKMNNGTPSVCASLAPDPYPMAGEAMHKVTVGVYDVASGKTVYLNVGDPTDRYFTNLAWSPDAKRIYLIELNRDQTDGSLDEYDAATGEKIRTVFTEHDDKYFEPNCPIQFLPWDGSKFVYQTRRDGYNHLYLYDVKGKLLRQLTKGKYEVMSVLGFNAKERSVVYSSNEADPLQQNVYSVSLQGRKKLLGNGKGWHMASLSKSGAYVIDRYSAPDVPRCIDLVNVDNGKVKNFLTAKDPWAEYDVPEIKTGTIKAADGVTDLYYRLVLPVGFDATKKYPAVVYVYGGPHAHNIDASNHWDVRGWDIWMAQRGYVMFCLDNRGSENRGLAFEQATFRHLGEEEMKDQLCGVNFLKSLPYVDGDRLGVHGWSFGGFMTTSLMTTYPDVFKVGVAGGPVIDWRFYEVMYGERYMDTPQSNPEGYDSVSLLGKAKNLKGRLMIIYGGNDPVCVPQHTLSFVRACIDAGTYPDLFTYPGDEHNMFGTDRVHLHNVITRYFDDHLK